MQLHAFHEINDTAMAGRKPEGRKTVPLTSPNYTDKADIAKQMKSSISTDLRPERKQKAVLPRSVCAHVEVTHTQHVTSTHAGPHRCSGLGKGSCHGCKNSILIHTSLIDKIIVHAVNAFPLRQSSPTQTLSQFGFRFRPPEKD